MFWGIGFYRSDPFKALMSLSFRTESIEVDGKPLNGALTEMENSVLAFFWEGDKPKLGSLTVTLPDRTASQLLGDRDEILSKMVGERLVSRYGKLALVSTNLSLGFSHGRVLIDLADRLAGLKDE